MSFLLDASALINKNLIFSDGKLVNLDEVWDNVPDVYRERLAHEKWTFLTQQVPYAYLLKSLIIQRGLN